MTLTFHGIHKILKTLLFPCQGTSGQCVLCMCTHTTDWNQFSRNGVLRDLKMFLSEQCLYSSDIISCLLSYLQIFQIKLYFDCAKKETPTLWEAVPTCTCCQGCRANLWVESVHCFPESYIFWWMPPYWDLSAPSESLSLWHKYFYSSFLQFQLTKALSGQNMKCAAFIRKHSAVHTVVKPFWLLGNKESVCLSHVQLDLKCFVRVHDRMVASLKLEVKCYENAFFFVLQRNISSTN